MICNKCGNNLPDGSLFCNKCGNNLNNVPIKRDYSDLIKKGIVLGLLLLIIGLLVILLLKNDDTTSDAGVEGSSTGSRTIMIYMAGSNLEANLGIATSDLESINLETMDFDNVNVVLYAGGTKVWHNNFDSNENAIYHLTPDGFVKDKAYPLSNMGDADTLYTLLDYAYKNYKADNYDLLFWNHGGAIQGAIQDDYTHDLLDLSEFQKALDKSAFSSSNKLEMVIFRTCLNGTLEVASTFAPYANFLIASEEVTVGSATSHALDFIGAINPEMKSEDVGKMFIDSYADYMKNLDVANAYVVAYAIINLNKIGVVNSSLDEFAKTVNMDNHFNLISKTENNLFKYGMNSSSSYDMVDLHSLVNGIRTVNSDKADNVLNAISDAVVYFRTNNEDYSHGMSIYFPYEGTDVQKNNYLSMYKNLGYTPGYFSLIRQFVLTQRSGGTSSFEAFTTTSNPEVNSSSKEFSVQLTKEQMENFAGASYIIFVKQDNGAFSYVYISPDYNLSSDGILSTKLENRLLKIIDKETNESGIITLNRDAQGNLYTNAWLQYYDTSTSGFLDYEFYSADAYIKYDENNNPYIAQYNYVDSDESGLLNTILDEEDFSVVSFLMPSFNILDENGNFTTDFTSAGVTYGYEAKVGKYELVNTSLDDDKEYYCIFVIKDTKNNVFYSNLVQIN